MKTQYGKSPLIAMMEVIQRNKIAEEAKAKLNAPIQYANTKSKAGIEIDRILPLETTLEWLPMGDIDSEQSLKDYDDSVNTICRAFNIPASLLNTGEHSKTFKK